jgi:hypothetical protein
LLIEAGADPTMTDNEGCDAVDIAASLPTAENPYRPISGLEAAHPTNEVLRLMATVFGGWLPSNACGVCACSLNADAQLPS